MNYPLGQFGYTPYQYPTTITQQPPQGLIRVTGVEGAKAYQMPANSSAALFDANNDILYVKTTDGAGFPTIKQFSFTPMETEDQKTAEYVTRKEFNEFKEMICSAQQSIPSKQFASNSQRDQRSSEGKPSSFIPANDQYKPSVRSIRPPESREESRANRF